MPAHDTTKQFVDDNIYGGCPRGVMVKAMECVIVALLRSLSDKYLWERYEPPNPPSYGLSSTTNVLLGE